MIAAFTFFALPADSFNVDAHGRVNWQHGNHGHGNRGRKKRHWGYKNYGQYRSAQVHRRNRYRMVRRYYWRDGIRLTRWIRIYY